MQVALQRVPPSLKVAIGTIGQLQMHPQELHDLALPGGYSSQEKHHLLAGHCVVSRFMTERAVNRYH